MAISITSGPKRSVLRGQRHKMYRIVKNNINEGWFWNMIRNPMRGNNYAVRNNSGKLVGFAVMGKNVAHEGGAAYIYLIGTKSGQGYGTQLMNKIISNVKARGLKYILLEPITERVRTFYRRFGFMNITPELMVLNINKRKSPSPPSQARPSSSSLASVRRRAGKTPRH